MKFAFVFVSFRLEIMNRRNQDDLRLLKKAKRRVTITLILSYLILCLWPAAIYFLLGQPIFSRPDHFTVLYLVSMLAQMVIWMVIFFAVSEGKPATRHLFTVGLIGEFAFVAWLIYDMIRNPAFLAVYLIWAALELVKDFYLIWLSGWMKNSWYAKIYFDHTIELSESERQAEAERRRQAARRRAAAKAKAEREARERAEMEARRKKASYATNAYRQAHPQQTASSFYQPDIQQGAPVSNQQGVSSQPAQPYRYDPHTGQPLYPQNQNGQPAYQPQQGYPNQQTYPNQAGQPVSPAQSQANPQANGNLSVPSFASNPNAKMPQTRPVQPEASTNANADFQTDAELAAQTKLAAEKANRKKLSSAYPRTALRLALVVYGELICFPIGVHIFQNSFVSIDNSSVFAINLMFTLCILTAVVWTLPIFFLYLKQPGVKKMIWGAAAAQLGVLAFGCWVLYGHYKSETVIYSDKVFTLFAMLEVLRYGLLLIGVLPAFRLPEIRDKHTSKILSSPEDSDDVYEFELIDEEDPDEALDDMLGLEEDYDELEEEEDEDHSHKNPLRKLFR